MAINREIHQPLSADKPPAYRLITDWAIRQDGQPFRSMLSISEPLQTGRMGLPNMTVVAGTTIAGLGHTNVMMSCVDGAAFPHIPRFYYQGPSEEAHGVGSGDLGTAVTKWVVEHSGIEAIWERVHLQMLKPHLAHFEAIVQKVAPADSPDLLALCFHPEIAMGLEMLRGGLEAQGKKLIIALFVTDHFQPDNIQYLQTRLGADVIYCPGRVTKEAVEIGLERRLRSLPGDYKQIRMPQVVDLGGYPLPPISARPLSDEAYADRQRRLSGDRNYPPYIFAPMGGSLPQRDYIFQLARNFPTWHWSTVLKKPNGANGPYERFVAGMQNLGALVIQAETADQAVDETQLALGGGQPNVSTLILTKPSDRLCGIAELDPRQAGGAPLLVTEGVGHWEVNNTKHYQSAEGGRVLPTDDDSRALFDFFRRNQAALTQELISDVLKNELARWQQKARTWRGICLPADPNEAAFLIDGCWRHGIFAAMALHERKDIRSDINCLASVRWPESLPDIVQARINRGEGNKVYYDPTPPDLPKPCDVTTIRGFADFILNGGVLTRKEQAQLAGLVECLIRAGVDKYSHRLLKSMQAIKDNLQRR